MSGYDRNALTPEMTIDVTLGEFHDTHDGAQEIQTKMQKKSISQWSKEELQLGLRALEKGQNLTDAEDGPDFMYASSYSSDIKTLREELGRR